MRNLQIQKLILQSQVYTFLIIKLLIIQKTKTFKKGELEIIDLLNIYKKKQSLKAEFIGRGGAWLDAGNVKDYNEASNFVSAIENRQGLKIACLEEISLRNKWIGKNEIKNSINFYGKCEYSKYLKSLID